MTASILVYSATTAPAARERDTRERDSASSSAYSAASSLPRSTLRGQGVAWGVGGQDGLGTGPVQALKCQW
jgi:hypothetical protein